MRTLRNGLATIDHGIGLVALVLLLAACGGSPSGAEIEVTRIVTLEGQGEMAEVEVTREVTVEVTREVTVEGGGMIVVTATPEPATATPEPAPTVEAEVAFEVGNYQNYRTSIGSLYFIGEVANGSTIPARVKVTLALIDDSGNVIGTGSYNLVSLDVAPPGRPYPFKFLLDQVAEDSWASVEIQIDAEPLGRQFIFAPYTDLEAQNVSFGSTFFGTASISGRVVNTGEEAAELVQIVVVAYDAEGQVVDIADGYTDRDRVPAGEASTFSIDFDRIEATPASYEIYVEGTEASE